MQKIRIYLVRHGKAESDAPGGDGARRLTADGRRRFYALAGEVAERLELTRILSSPVLRARETAEILAAATGAPLEIADDLAPGRSGGRALLALARRAGAGAALVGHNPEMAEAIALAAGKERKVKPGAVAALDFGSGGPELAWLEAPEET